MKLEKWKEKKQKQKAIMIVSIVLVLLVTIIVIYQSFAFFEENQEFNVIKGSIPNQNYDLMLSFQIEDENGNRTISNTIPSDHNYEVSITCNNGASGVWNHEEWAPQINNLTNTRTKCTLLFTKKYKERILNGMDPVLSDGLIPVTIEDNGTVHKANEREDWYKYTEQRWANAVILEDESIVYQNGETIPESNIESYFVWIPKYRYKLWDLGNYEGLTSIDHSKVHDIEVIFGDYDTVDKAGECATPGVSGSSGKCKVGDYMTHSAFQAFGTKGLWVGKFEVGYKEATTTTDALQNTYDVEKVEVKPNVYSWRNINAANAHLNSYNYKREYDSHMMKNTEWGAVAYLQHSLYGSRQKVRLNNNSNGITGYAATKEPIIGFPAYLDDEGTNLNVDGILTKRYNSETGYLASTTKNITGIYDMSGGAWEFVMGLMLSSDNDLPCVGESSLHTSGFAGTYCNANGTASGIALPEEKYYDLYQNEANYYSYKIRILGDATGEMGPFGSVKYGNSNRFISSWYAEEEMSIYHSASWNLRGGTFNNGSSSGIFDQHDETGDVHYHVGFRIVLAI